VAALGGGERAGELVVAGSISRAIARAVGVRARISVAMPSAKPASMTAPRRRSTWRSAARRHEQLPAAVRSSSWLMLPRAMKVAVRCRCDISM